MNDLTQLVNRWEQGDVVAADQLLPLVYGELRRLAAQRMKGEPPGQTLQPTALVHEAWLRLAAQDQQHYQGRDQFFAAAAEMMRRILVDRARRRKSLKHGGAFTRVELSESDIPAPDDELVLHVHEALQQLEAEDPEKADIVRLRFFVGFSNEETAVLLGIDERTVRRHWTFAKAWLTRRLRDG